jgi:hypothetical protein
LLKIGVRHRASAATPMNQALLELARRRTKPPPFLIVTPAAFAASAP